MTNIYLSRPIQSLGKLLKNNKVRTISNNYLPNIQSAIVTATYCTNIAKSDLPSRNKKNMLVHDLLCSMAGIALSATLVKFSNKSTDKIIKKLDKNKIKHLTDVKSGIKILAPIVITTFVMRLVNPVLAIPLAEKINKFMKNK